MLNYLADKLRMDYWLITVEWQRADGSLVERYNITASGSLARWLQDETAMVPKGERIVVAGVLRVDQGEFLDLTEFLERQMTGDA